MGRPKALLPFPSGRSFVSELIASLRDGGLARIAVVGRRDDDDLSREIVPTSVPVDYVVNPDPDRGQLSSLVVGVEYAVAHAAAGALVVPVDMPLIQSSTIATALEAFHRSALPVLRMTHGGRHGHPVIFRASVFDTLRLADPSVGARAVMREDPSRVQNVEVDDPGVLRDFDWPAEYRQTFGDLS